MGATRLEQSRLGAEFVLALPGAGVEPLVLAGEVESPVLLEVAVTVGWFANL